MNVRVIDACYIWRRQSDLTHSGKYISLCSRRRVVLRSMTVKNTEKKGLKRKELSEDENEDANELGGDMASLEMLTDEEGDGDANSDDEQVDKFPEIYEGGDSEEEESGGDVESENESEGGEENADEEAEDDEDTDSDASELHIFPQAKTVISNITGQPKRVYPEIEPEYDSDSSTEDVSNPWSF